MYVKNNLSYSILDLIPESEVFEGLFIKIQNKHNPIDEFNLILQTFEELSYRAYIWGDYNIDLLQIENSNKVVQFILPKHAVCQDFSQKLLCPPDFLKQHVPYSIT